MERDELDKTYTVSEILKIIEETFQDYFPPFVVIGEVGNISCPQSGHVYFSLKDKTSTLNCVIFRSSLFNCATFKTGDKVVVHGSLTLYKEMGKMQLSVRKLTLEGDGELKKIIEERKKLFQSLGYFDQDKKKDIPTFIKTIGVVTSRSGAVIHDILKITKERAPSVSVILFPTSVQGNAAGENISSRIRQANNSKKVDVLIVGRGGGSLEDLMCWNDECVVKAIYESEIPIISSIGHQVDWTLSDYAADKRASTPTEAGAFATEGMYKARLEYKRSFNEIKLQMKNIIYSKKQDIQDKELLYSYIENKINNNRYSIPDITTSYKSILYKIKDAHSIIDEGKSLKNHLLDKINNQKQSVNFYIESIERDIKYLVENTRRTIFDKKKDIYSIITNYTSFKKDNIDENITSCFNNITLKIKDLKLDVKRLCDTSSALSPQSVLKRGFSYVTDKSGKTITISDDVSVGDEVNITLNKGKLSTKVLKKEI